MKLNDAIVKRIEEICKERGSNICDIALSGGMSPSAIYDLIKGRTKCSKVITVKRFCEGAGMTLSEFFDKDYLTSPKKIEPGYTTATQNVTLRNIEGSSKFFQLELPFCIYINY